jgi:hypothetical protein
MRAIASIAAGLELAWHDEQHYDRVLARAVLCQRCDSEPTTPLAGLALRS